MVRAWSGWRRIGTGVLLVVLMQAPTVYAQSPDRTPTTGRAPTVRGSSDPMAEAAAKKGIPWNKLSQKNRRIAHYIVRNNSVFRRMPTQTIECDPEVFTFLAQRPEIVTGVWNVMGVSPLEVRRISPTTFRAADNAGTEGALRVLHADWGPDAKHRVVLYAEGVYEAKPLPRPIRAHSLLVLQSAAGTNADGTPMVTARLDSFIHFERAAADLVAKTISPLITNTADHNFVETMNFVSTFSQTTQRNPRGIARLAGRLENLDEQVRGELIQLCPLQSEQTNEATRQANRVTNLMTVH
ncbi:MAG: hypothetical protein AAGF31_07715 [Planctomycetota bacterium]